MILLYLTPFLRQGLLLACLLLTLGLFLSVETGPHSVLAQESPLSPLQATQEPPLEATPTDPLAPLSPSVDRAPLPTVYPAPSSNLPLGEPLQAQTSLLLVGLVLAGLVVSVLLIGVRWRS